VIALIGICSPLRGMLTDSPEKRESKLVHMDTLQSLTLPHDIIDNDRSPYSSRRNSRDSDSDDTAKLKFIEILVNQRALELRSHEIDTKAHTQEVKSITKKKIACYVAASSIVSAIVTATVTLTIHFTECE